MVATAEPPLVITGATATGKTDLSLRVARRRGAEIVVMDSRQVYRGMDIGTAKVTLAERGVAPHHGLDIVGPDERYSAGRFSRDAHRWIREIRGRGALPLLVGGTGFFLRALTTPLFEEPPVAAAERERLRGVLRQQGDAELLRWLRSLDPELAGRLELGGGRQRVLRGLEVALLSGRPLSWWQRNAPAGAPALEVRVVVLELPRQTLYDRIDARVQQMLDAGLLAEVRRLRRAGFGRSDPGMNATGYIELLDFLFGDCSYVDAVDRIRRATRRYARRQHTWFRHQLSGAVCRLDGTRPHEELVEAVLAFHSQETS